MDNEESLIKLEIWEEEIQSFAEANFGRQLTLLELHRVRHAWFDVAETLSAQSDLLSAVIEYVTDNEKTDWATLDAEFKE